MHLNESKNSMLLTLGGLWCLVISKHHVFFSRFLCHAKISWLPLQRCKDLAVNELKTDMVDHISSNAHLQDISG